MKAKGNFEEKLHEKFQDFSVPLRDSQWNKMEQALLEKKNSKRRWFMIWSLLFLVAGVSFAGGYLWNNSGKEVNQKKASNQTTISSPEQNDVSTINTPSLENFSEPEAELNSAEQSGKVQEVKVNANSVGGHEVVVLTQQRKEDIPSVDYREVKNSSQESVNMATSDESMNGFLNKGSKATDDINIINEKTRGFDPFQFKSNPFNLTNFKLNHIDELPNALPLAMDIPPIPKWDLPKQRLLSKLKAATSLQFTSGGYIATSSIAPETGDSSSFIGFLPGLEESITNQVAKGSGVRFGLGFQTEVFRGLSVGSSLVYNQFTEKNNFEQIHNFVPFFDSSMQTVIGFIQYDDSLAPRTEVEINNELRYLQIPLTLWYSREMFKKFRIGVSAGYTFNLPLSLDMSYYNIFNFSYEKLDKEMFNLGAQTQLGVHLDYKVWKKAWIGVNYEFANSTNNLRFLGNQIDLRNRSNRINLGLTIKL